MTGRFGIYQHAKEEKPDPDHGFCTDDNARILILLTDLERLPDAGEDFTDERKPLLDFLIEAFNPETGCFRNFMDHQGNWLEERGSEDSHGRALWALGHFIGHGPDGPERKRAAQTFSRALTAAGQFVAPRAWAFTLLGLAGCRNTPAFNVTARQLQTDLAARLERLFVANAGEGWDWFEEAVTYDNGKVSEALIATGHLTGNRRWLDWGLRSLKFLLKSQTAPEGHFRAIGCRGFWKRGGEPARYDQQPLEAQSMASACLAAWRATGDPLWREKALKIHDWFLGGNDLGIPVAVPETGGCHDGLCPDSLNLNQGAESTWAWLQSRVDILHARSRAFFRPGAGLPAARPALASSVAMN